MPQNSNEGIYNIVETDVSYPVLRDTAVVLDKKFVKTYSLPIQKGGIPIVQMFGPSWVLDLSVGNNMRGQCVVSQELGTIISIGSKLYVRYIIERPSGVLRILNIK